MILPNNRHRLHANAIRALSMDAVEQAASGHPGAPMGMADMAEVLFNRFLRHNPNNPQWPNRDRFVLSNGHGSLLIYTALHLSGYALSLSDLRQFRQLHSKTPGHPEYGETPGIETTTGPLGQGLANAVGMALAERNLAHTFNREGLPLVDHYSYVFAGDGCLMEGLSHEAASLAGTLGLGKLIVLYDDNQISIDGRVDGWFTDNSAQRFAAYGWHVVEGVDGHDADAVEGAIKQAQAQSNQPSIICCRTTIGFGAPNKQDTAASHGAPLGADEIAAARQQLGWKWPPFVVPEEVYKHWDARQKGAQAEDEWQQIEADYRRQHPQLAAEFERRCQRQLPADWPEFSQQLLRDTDAAGESPASRKASHVVISAVAPQLPELLGGSADLTGSNLTRCSAAQDILPGMPAQGDYIYYGVREFGMSAIMNGISLHGGFRPYGGTFLVFSDYARNALRMSALMKQPVIYVYTHDSIGLGEDGPTHQPVEHLACLRLIPGLSLWRPGDATETVAAWIAAIERQDGPTCLVLSRQALAAQQRDAATLAQVGRGGYVLQACSNPDAVVIATGSELELARAAIAQSRRQIQLVSMPCTDRFDAQPAAYRDSVLPTGVPRIAIEAGNSDYWRRYVGLEGDVVGIDSFGASAPAEVLFPHFGFTADNLLTTVENTLAKGK